MQTAQLKTAMAYLAQNKTVGAHIEGPSYEISVQDRRWTCPGELEVFSGRQCLIELCDPPPRSQATYVIGLANGRTRTTGTLNFLPPGASRKIRWSEGERRAILCVFEPERLGLLNAIDWRWDEIDPDETLDLRNDRLRTGMQWLAEETSAPSFASELGIGSILAMMAIELHRSTARPLREERPAAGKLSQRQLATLRERVEGAPDPGEVSLAALAAACELPTRELSKMFKRTTGKTLRSYVASAHIARAKLLLNDGSLLIKQVAYSSGFRSAAAFGDAFRRATGWTPLQYRQSQGVVSREARANG